MSIDEKWVILPIDNHLLIHWRLRICNQMLESQLRSRGISDIETQTIAPGSVRPVRLSTIKGYRYALTGTVSRWQYDVETGRTPEVSLALQVHDLSDGSVLWEDRLLRKGRGQTSVSAVANKLIDSLLSQLNLKSGLQLDQHSVEQAPAYVGSNEK